MAGGGEGVLGTHVDALPLVQVVGAGEVELAVAADEDEVGLAGRAVVVGGADACRAGRVAQDAGVVRGVEEVAGQTDTLTDTQSAEDRTGGIAGSAVGGSGANTLDAGRLADSAGQSD